MRRLLHRQFVGALAATSCPRLDFPQAALGVRFSSTATGGAEKPIPVDETKKNVPSEGTDILCKIARGELPATVRYSDEVCIAIDDVNPVAPVHVLIVPRLHIDGISSMASEKACNALSGYDDQEKLVGHLFTVANKVARELGIAESGYRTVFNNGKDGGQTVPHLHLHLLGGRRMKWPPG